MAEESTAAPGADPRAPVRRAGAWPGIRPVAAVAAGGALGALARYGVSVALPHPPGAFAWSTWLVNVSGCLLIGVLMTLIAQVWPRQRLLRPFWGVGVLGGYTTFSAYVLDAHQAISAGAPGTALAYLAGTLVAAVAAVWAGGSVTAWALRRRRAARASGGDAGGEAP